MDNVQVIRDRDDVLKVAIDTQGGLIETDQNGHQTILYAMELYALQFQGNPFPMPEVEQDQWQDEIDHVVKMRNTSNRYTYEYDAWDLVYRYLQGLQQKYYITRKEL